MSDNVDITPGTGATVAADLIGGALHQRIKVRWGVDGSAVDASATDPFPVDVLSLADGEGHKGAVGGHLVPIRPTWTITAGAYGAGDVIGGELTLTNAMRVTDGTGRLDGITIFDADNEGAAMEIMLFDANPAGTYTDNAAPTWNAADEAKFLCGVSVASTDYITVNGMKMADKPNLGRLVKANGSQNLYAVIVVTGTPTYGTTSDLTICFWFIQN